MSFLSGILGGKSKRTAPTVASGLQLQSSSYGSPIPLVYGTSRVAPNLIWYGDFEAIPQSASGGGKGGVTGGGKSGSGTNYVYQVAVAMGLCEGPIRGVGNAYVDKNVVTPASLGLSLFPGNYPQSPWGYLVTNFTTQVTETHTIPVSYPYTVPVNDLGFVSDLGVTESGLNVPFTKVSANPSANHFTWFSTSWLGFNSANAGESVTIIYKDIFGQGHTVNSRIPSAAPYQINIPLTNYGIEGIVSVTATAIGFSRVNSLPASNQYSVASGIYTFNSANAGQTVQVSYTTNISDQALGYNGIAYLAASAYQLGSSPQLPNHNVEVQGIFSNSVRQEIIGEQDTIPGAAYINAYNVSLQAYQLSVQFAAAFIADNGVTDIAGNSFRAISGNPGYYEYARSGGVYTFSPANAGTVVNISYQAGVGPDADPSLVVADFLTNPHYGAAFTPSRVGSLSTYQAYCIASGLLISPVYNQQQQASQMLDELATATNSAWVWSNGLLTIIPYGDQNITANGYTYTAPSSPLYDLTDDDFDKNSNVTGAGSSSMNDDPIILARKRPADQINSIKIECLDRNNQYNPAIIEAKDQALIQLFGLRQSQSSQAHLFCNLAAGRLSAQLQLQRQAIRNIYSFTLDQRYIVLDPMDIVTLTDSYLGLNKQWVRITEITENDDQTLSIVAEEYLDGTGNAPVYSYQSGTGFSANYNAGPGNVNTPVIFEPTDALAGELAVWMAVSGVNTAFWGGCDIWISTDGNTYRNAGSITGAARQGILTAPVGTAVPAATGPSIDTVSIVSVDLSESGGQLISGTQADALNLSTLCYVDGELMAYQTATLTSGDAYNLSWLVRGAYDTTISAHNAGTLFTRLDNGIFKYPYDASLIGTTIYIKFLSFNVYSGGQQSLLDVQPFSYILQGTAFTSPLPNVTGFATAYIAGLTQLIWNPVSDFRPIDYEIRLGATWSNSLVVGRTPLIQTPILGDGSYWIAAHFTVPNGGADIYSETPVSLVVTGSQITQNVIASYDQAGTGWSGTFNNTTITGFGLQLTGASDILSDPDYLNTPNILFFGGVANSGTYEIPVSQRVNIGRVAPCQVIFTLGTDAGFSINATNVLTLVDYLGATNLLGVDLGNNTSTTPQIRLSQDGTTWGNWQNWIPGSYSAMAFDAQVLLQTLDPSVVAVLSDFTFAVDVPDLVQTGTNVSVASSGTTITFPHTFNGGPNSAAAPNVQVTILSGSQGDDVLLTSKTISGFDLQIVNGGVGVARTVDWVAQGY